MKKIISLVLLIAAIGTGAFVIINDQRENASNSSEALDAYMNQDGIEREMPDESEMISFDTIDQTGVSPGMKARDFQLPALNSEKEVALEEMQGNFVIINMWATWCPPCKEEMPDFVKFYEDYQGENLEMIGINMTATERNKESVNQFVEDFNVPFYTLLDQEGVMEDLYEVYVMPSTYIIDPDGRVAMNRPGYISYEVLEESYLEIKKNYESENK